MTSADDILRDPAAIEARSFAIIDEEIGPHDFDQQHWQVVRRIIHTSADFDFARTTWFSPEVLPRAIDALRSGARILCDTSMVLGGVNKTRLAAHGASITCHVADPEVAQTAREEGVTRSIIALRKGVAEGCRIFAIGNAPTALYELLRLKAEGLVDPEVQDIADRLDAFANTVVGYTDVFLDGRPGEVGREETNLGNLLADANLAAARAVDPSVLVSLKGAGGIAGALGDADTGTPPEGGGITVADHFEVLPEDGDLVLLTLTGAQLVAALEHAVSADTAETRFAQVSGVEFSFDPTAPAGARIQSAQVVDTDGTPLVDLVYRGAVLVPDATIRIVTTQALAEGGEGYPFAEFRADDPDRLDPVSLGSDERSGAATFADDGTGLDALAEYLAANHGTEATAFDQAETPPSGDMRIQNLDLRADDVFEFDKLVFGDGGRVQRFDLGAGIDKLALDDELSNGIRQRFLVRGFEEGDMPGFDRDDILSIREAGPNLLVYIDNDDRDSFTFFGVDGLKTLFGSTDLA